MNTEYKIKEEFPVNKGNTKTLEQILEEVFVSYLIEKINQ